jgi:carboxyl-terminal processing protease
MFKKILKYSFLAFFFIAFFLSGYFVGLNSKKADFLASLSNSSETLLNSKPDLSLFWEVWARLEERYIDKSKLDPQNLLYGAIAGMVKAVGDPHTSFFNPKDTKRFFEDVSGEFEGIGIEISMKKGQLVVVAPLEGTPAQKIGIKAGDKILKIGDTLTSDLTLDEAVNMIRGPKGTEVVLMILREGWDLPREFKIMRDKILVPSLKWELKGDIAYIKLYHFSQKADVDFRKAALEIEKSKASKIILDLRNNPGGFLEVAQNIAGWFLERGKVVAIEDFGNGEKREFKSPGPSKLINFPLVVLINNGSASASEILAAALRDHRQVKLVGEKSFGKGSVQEMERFKDDSSLKVTVARWLSPKGTLIDGVGLEPDIKVELKEEEKETQAEKDPQLEKAIELLNKNI